MSFNIGSCRITVSFYFFAVLCICSLSDRSSIMISGITAALVHEAGHLASIFFSGLSPKSLTVNSAGIRMYVPGLDARRGVCIITALSGAAANLLLFIVSVRWSESLAAASISLCILSLLPCEPFDGGIVLRAVLEKYLSEKHADRILLISTLLFLLPVICMGTYILISSRYNFSLLILSMLIFTTICQRTLK